jgi:hypothetical protein
MGNKLWCLASSHISPMQTPPRLKQALCSLGLRVVAFWYQKVLFGH